MFDESVLYFAMYSSVRVCSLFKTYFSLLSSWILNPSWRKVSAIFTGSFGGGCWAIFCIPVFSAKGLYFAMKAGNNAYFQKRRNSCGYNDHISKIQT